MNTSRMVPVVALVAALLPCAAWSTAASPLSAPTAPVATPVSGAPVAAPTKKPRKKNKRYSKATLSAFQPLPAPAAKTKTPAAAGTAAAIALSPVVSKQAVGALQAPPAPVLPVDDGSGPVEIPVVDAAYDEETSLAQHERDTAPAGDSTALGQESVSVIDRFADKPKAKPISNGPLKVRMKDSGVRASVQIPLDTIK